ncbi:MAG TPA: hypothetical protein VGJ86_06215 [Acidimicrobiales bacterium]
MATVGIGVSMALLVGACSGDDESGDDAKGDDNSDRPDERDPTPLDEFWQSVGGGDMSDDEMADQERRLEQRVADCMQQQGFEYTPVESNWSGVSAEADSGPWSLPPEEFAEKYGYGMFTMDPVADEDTVDDPNQERVDAMSDAERAAYEAALWGSYDENTGELIGDGEGCQSTAWAEENGGDPNVEENGGDPNVEESEFNDLWEEMDALYEGVNTDSRVADEARKWSDCMADTDHPDLEVPDDAPQLVNDRYQELLPPELRTPDDELSEGGPALALPGGERDDSLGLAPDDLRDLKAYEIEVAAADLECRGDYDDVHYDVQVELEKQFIEDHRDELDRYREAFSTSGGG